MAIPQTVRASKAVAHAEHYTGEVPAAQLRRLAASTDHANGRITADWRAGRDAAGHPELFGRIGGSIALVCQHCLGAFDWTVDINVQLRLVDSDAEEARVLHECDPYRVHGDALPLREMTEDEVLLALPLMPRCETCENNAHTEPAGESSDESEGPKPLAALKQFKF